MSAKGGLSPITCRLEVINKLGLHARVAARIAEVVSAFECEVELSKDGLSADASSILSILTLDAPKGSVITAIAKGNQAQEALEALEAQFAQSFGE